MGDARKKIPESECWECPRGAQRKGKRHRPPDRDRPRGTREKNIPESELWECLLGRGERGKHVGGSIRMACGGHAKQNS
eukprot:9674313-Karenia_brevis.AAC.1